MFSSRIPEFVVPDENPVHQVHFRIAKIRQIAQTNPPPTNRTLNLDSIEFKFAILVIAEILIKPFVDSKFARLVTVQFKIQMRKLNFGN